MILQISLRTIVAALLLSAIPSLSAATLILVIPTKDGVVITADSRQTVQGKHFDAVKKIYFLSNNPAFAYSFTGHSSFAAAPPAGNSLESWVRVVKKEFDAAETVGHYLSTNRSQRLDPALLNSLGNFISGQLSDYFAARPEAAAPFSGKPICRFLAVTFDARTRTTTIGGLLLSLSEDRRVVYSTPEITEINSQDRVFVGRYGEADYVDRNVMFGPGKRYIPADVVNLWSPTRRVSQMTPAEAHIIGEAIIKATEKTAEFIPASSGIGGPVYSYLLDGKNSAVQLKRKR